MWHRWHLVQLYDWKTINDSGRLILHDDRPLATGLASKAMV